MKIVLDKRIPGLLEGISSLPGGISPVIVAREGTEITAEDVRDADFLFVRTRTRCDASLLSGSNVRLVGTATIGTDHIDIPWCEANGISVVSAPGCNAPAVMQYVAATLHEAGFDPSVQTLGVVGKGNIGSLVVSLYRAAGARVLVCDPPRHDAGFDDEDYLALEEVLAQSDAVTFHVPYDATTRHMLTPGLLKQYPDLKIVVNTSRGLVLHPDIFRDDVFLEGQRRFIIDTWPFEDEPDQWSREERNRVIDRAFISTPHIAGYSIEGKRRATYAMLSALASSLGLPSAPEASPVDAPPVAPELKSLERVISSFDPLPLSAALKSSPSSFEALRASHLRPEP